MTRVTRNPAPTTGTGGRTPIRPMYGVFIRDQVATFRAQINQTIKDTKAALKAGDPKAKAIPGNFKLEGTEWKKANLAVKDLERAVKALKPVFGNTGPATTGDTNRTGRPSGGPGGGMIAMYGIVFRDDLTAYRSSVNKNLMDIRAAINNGGLKGEAKAEAQKAVKYLESALKDLGRASGNWQ
jgi:hypothetical protein